MNLTHFREKQQGWGGCGYHFVVSEAGMIERSCPEHTQSVHASGANSNSIGICFEDYDVEQSMLELQKNCWRK